MKESQVNLYNYQELSFLSLKLKTDLGVLSDAHNHEDQGVLTFEDAATQLE